MKTNKKGVLALPIVIGILVGLFAIVILVAAVTGGTILGKGDTNVVCRVNLDADLFSNVDIEKATCTKEPGCPLFGSKQLGFLPSRDGKVFLIGSDGKNYDDTSYSIELLPLPQEQDVVLNGCLPNEITTRVTLKTISDDNEIQDTKVVEVK